MSHRQRMSRRYFLESLAAGIAVAPLSSAAVTPQQASTRATDIIAGAIRWDAWYKREDASLSAQSSLSSQRYYKRAPFFCSVATASQVYCTGTVKEMDAEIHAAVKGGLKYWAFDWYAPDSSLRTAWTLYRQSRYRNLINWCGLVGPSLLGSVPFSNNKWQDNMRDWAGYMREPNYQKVTAGEANRPLLYILWDESQLKWYFDNDLANVRKCIDCLRDNLTHFGNSSPYVVILDATAGAPIARAIGADAISNYISGFTLQTVGPYIELDKQTREFWKQMADTGVPTIPIAMVGWDTRARQEKPVPWEQGTPNPNPTKYYILPTPREFSTHVQAAVEFIHTHPEACPSKVLLIYSWDECDEGGGLIPTLGDPKGSYLRAISSVIS